eukprot:RCo027525
MLFACVFFLFFPSANGLLVWAEGFSSSPWGLFVVGSPKLGDGGSLHLLSRSGYACRHTPPSLFGPSTNCPCSLFVSSISPLTHCHRHTHTTSLSRSASPAIRL